MSTIRAQYHRPVTIATPLEPGVLLPVGVSGTEQLSRLFEYTVELFSQQPDKVKSTDLLGDTMTLQLELSNGQSRYFNGYVSRFVQTGVEGDTVTYEATLVPWLWFLTRTSDCRIFQKKDVPTIIKQVFQDLGFSDFKDSLSGSYRKWEYCTQYRETAFNFVSRLMEQEGIYYYFKHDANTHTLILADSVSAHDPFPGYKTIRYLPPNQGESEEEFISQWRIEHQFQPGKYALNDFNFTTPKADLKSVTPTKISIPGFKQYEVYDYPGEYTKGEEGSAYSKIRMQEIDIRHETVSGVSDARGLCTGSKFDLADHPLEKQNKTYLVTSASYHLQAGDYTASQANGETTFSCGFTAIDADPEKCHYRPPLITPKPVVQGSQTAIVAGDPKEEIDTDKYGRIKVQFHWDREGKFDENSSCWIRVSQTWAGKKWGSVFIPRIGQEVLVDFLEGDPDRPIVIGSVYNNNHMPPFDLPKEKNQSGFKSDTTKGGGGKNSIVFDDTKGVEKLTIHSQYDMSSTVKHDRSTTIETGNDTLAVQAGTKSTTVKGDTSLTVEAGSRTVNVTGGKYSADVNGGDFSAVASAAVVLHGKGAGAQMTGDASGVKITGNGQGVEVTGNGGTGVKVDGTPNFEATGAAEAKVMSPLVKIGDTIIEVKGSMVTVDGSTFVKLVSGGSCIEITPGAINITSAGPVNISGGGDVGVTAPMIKLNG